VMGSDDRGEKTELGEGTLPSQPARRARERAEAASRSADGIAGRLRKNGTLRIGAFFLAVGPFLLLETSPRGLWPPLIGTGLVALGAFAFLVRRHRRLARQRDRERLRARLYMESMARMGRRWREIPIPDLGAAPTHHPCAADLDLLGQGSLAQLLSRVSTEPGLAALGRTLLDPLAPLPSSAADLLRSDGSDSPSEGEPANPPAHPVEWEKWSSRVRRRQEAVRRLAADPDLLENLELAARSVEGTPAPGRTRAFLTWCGEGPWLAERRWLIWAARGTAAFNVLTLVGWLAGWIAPPIWLLGMLGAHLLHRWSRHEAHRRFSAAEGGEGDPTRWARLLELARDLPEDDPVLASIRERAGSPAPGAAGGLLRLRRINDVAAIRYSGMAHFPLVTLFAWDLHVLDRLERWQSQFGHEAEAWVLAVADLEVLMGLAGLKHEHPDWSFPSFTPDREAGISGRQLGHPLLPPATCVGNDVDVPPPGTLLLVTGSNMAGKTTLLRALGANQILALAGGPVAASEMTTRPVVPWTAMRVQDSVQDGVSLFMAELQRLKRVVEAARQSPILFLLDEILQGTNTAERRTAARIVLRHLLETGAVGAVTTHDLTLADASDLQARSVDIHFREDVVERNGRKRLHFDYKLRPGPATSRNALLLLDLVGLGPNDEDS